MMIGDNQVDSGAARSFCGGKGPDAGIDADDQPHAIGRGALDDFVAHAIAFTDPVRHVKIRRAPTQFDGSLKDDNCGGTVHVVIAIDQHLFFALDRSLQPVQRQFHAGHLHRVVQVVKRGRKKTGCHIGIFNPAADEQIGKHRQSICSYVQFQIAERRYQQPRLRAINRIRDPSHKKLSGRTQISSS